MLRLTVSAPGSDDIGAFAIASAAPDDIEGVSPRARAGDSLSRGGTAVEWEAGNGDLMIIRLRVGGALTQMECLSPDDGHMDIPAFAFAWLPADARGATMELRRVVSATADTRAPVAEVEFELERVYSDRLPFE